VGEHAKRHTADDSSTTSINAGQASCVEGDPRDFPPMGGIAQPLALAAFVADPRIGDQLPLG